MKKTIQKITAGVSALAMAAALSVSTVPAFASEYDAVLEEKFVSSFEDAETQKVAQYLFDNGISLEEAKDMMDTYERGLELIAEREAAGNVSVASVASADSDNGRINTNTAFYSGTQLAQTQHYGVLIKDNAKSSAVAFFRVSYDSAWISYDFDALEHRTLSSTSNVTFQEDSDNANAIVVSAIMPATSTTTAVPVGIADFPFDIITGVSSAGNYTESTVKNKFSLNAFYNTSSNGLDTTYDFHTYAIGDIDHSGYVDEADSTYMLQFMVQIIDSLKFHYTDESDNIADIINTLAMDANRDGVINMSDSIAINRLANS